MIRRSSERTLLAAWLIAATLAVAAPPDLASAAESSTAAAPVPAAPAPGPSAAPAAAPAPAAPQTAAPAGVANAQRAWQNWTLNCQGCHRVDGSGSEGTAPGLAGTVAKFLWVPGGREYLIRVPGVAASPLPDDDLAEVVNWMLWRFDAANVPADFQPYTAAEVGRLRSKPLRLEAAQMRGNLLQKAEARSASE